QEAALVKIREVFKNDFASLRLGPQKQAFARKLLDVALTTKNDNTARYVLFISARDMAAQAGDLSLAFRAIAEQRKLYGTDEPEMKLQALRLAAKSPLTTTQWAALAQTSLTFIDPALASDDYTLAREVANMAVEAAKKTTEGPLIRQTVQRAK